MNAPPDEPRAGQTFPKSARLLRRSEFLAVQSKGQRVHTTHFTLALRARADGDAQPRLGVTASRKAANSVGRNRVRRLVREVFRLNQSAFPAGWDCVVIVHEKVPELDLATVRDELLGALARRRGGGGGGGGNRGGGSGRGGSPHAPGRGPGGSGGAAGSAPGSPDGPRRPTGQTRPADTKKPPVAPAGDGGRRPDDRGDASQSTVNTPARSRGRGGPDSTP